MSGEEIDVDTFAQRDGCILLTNTSGDGTMTMVVQPDDRITLLIMLMTAIRLHGDDEEKNTAAKVAISHLGATRFKR